MIRATIGVIGHVDHGKTALVGALTGMDTDRLPEEKRRGISIALGFAHLRADGADIDLIDMPGHENFVRTMIAGASGIDAVLLVVAANERVKPQTEEHVGIAALLGVRRAVIAISKCDLVTPEAATLAAHDAEALAARAGLEIHGTIQTSAGAGTGLDALRDALAAVARAAKPPESRGFAWLPVDRAFSLAGHGTIVTGTLRHGVLTPAAELEILPGKSPARVRAIQVHGGAVAEARPGQRVAVNLRGIEPSDLPRGSALATPGILTPASWLSVQLHLLASAPRAVRTTALIKLLAGTAEIVARLRFLDRDELAPGETCVAQLQCAEPMALPARERFVIRDLSPAVTIGGGTVLEPGETRLRRHAPLILQRLQFLARADVSGIIAGELIAAGASGCRTEHLARLAGIAPGLLATHLAAQPADIIAAGVAVLSSVMAQVTNTLSDSLIRRDSEAPGTGIPLDTIAAVVTPAPSPAVAEEAMARLAASGLARRDGGFLRLNRPDQDRAAADQESALMARLAERLRAAGFQPPDPHELAATHPRARTALDRLLRAGLIVRAADRAQKRDLLFHRDTVRRAQELLGPLLRAEPGLLTRDAGEALGVSRKYSIPLLEHLDAIRFTRRVGDRRVLASAIAPQPRRAETST